MRERVEANLAAADAVVEKRRRERETTQKIKLPTADKKKPEKKKGFFSKVFGGKDKKPDKPEKQQ